MGVSGISERPKLVQFQRNFYSKSYWYPEDLKKVSMGLTDRRKTAKNLADSLKNWKILAVSRK